MSFFGSDSTRNNVLQQQQQQQQHQQSQLDSNLWPDQPLDPLPLQQADQRLSQMNATLQRQTPSQIDPLFTIPRTSPSEFQSYPSNQQDNNHLVFDVPGSELNSNSTARHFHSTRIEQPQSLQNQNNMLQTPWDRQPSSFPRYNLNSVPTTPFDTSQGILSNPSLLDYPLRKSPTRDILSSCVEKLLEFHRAKRQAILDHSDRNIWQALTTDFFMPNAKLKVTIFSRENRSVRTLVLPIETLPRIWTFQYDESIKEETIFIENARPHFGSNCVIVESENTLILSAYEGRTIQATGHLKVSFHESKRILSWEFKYSNISEVFARDQLTMGIPQIAFNEFAIPNTALRMMHIADAIYRSKLKPEDKPRQQISQAQQQLTNGPLPTSITNQANLAHERFAEQIHTGNMKGAQMAAYGVLLSQMTGGQQPGLDSSLITPQYSRQFDSMNLSRATAGMRSTMENGDQISSGVPDASLGLKRDQIGAEPVSRLFDGPMNAAPLQQDNNMDVRAKNNSQAELSQNSRVDSKIAQVNSRIPRQYAVDAVNAIARGQVNLELHQSTERKAGPSYQLIGSCSDESLRLNGSMAMGGPNASGQSTPAGLKRFEPNANARDSNVGRNQYPRSNSRGLKRSVSGEPHNTDTNAPNRGDILLGKQDGSDVNRVRKPSLSKGGSKSNREHTNSVARRTSMGRSASPNTTNNRDKRQKSVNSKPD